MLHNNIYLFKVTYHDGYIVQLAEYANLIMLPGQLWPVIWR